ncbi:MAG: hypothetical protein WBA89_02740 [Microcoleus sp.]
MLTPHKSGDRLSGIDAAATQAEVRILLRVTAIAALKLIEILDEL